MAHDIGLHNSRLFSLHCKTSEDRQQQNVATIVANDSEDSYFVRRDECWSRRCQTCWMQGNDKRLRHHTIHPASVPTAAL